MSDLNLTIVLLLVGMTLIAVVEACVLAWIGLKASRCLMWFHAAGNKLAEHEVRMAELQIKAKQEETRLLTTQQEQVRRSFPTAKHGEQGLNRTTVPIGS
jgi:uncharacterized membrane protein